jgi:hypothetical protein
MSAKILVWDLENSPALGWFWGSTYQTNITKVHTSSRVMSFAAKWHGSKRVEYRSDYHGADGKFDPAGNHHDGMVGRIWELLDEADAVISYNGRKHDTPHINTERQERHRVDRRDVEPDEGLRPRLAGCDHCYAMTMAKRLKAMGSAPTSSTATRARAGPASSRTSGRRARLAAAQDEAATDLRQLDERPVPRRITDEYIAEVFAVMAQCPQHTFQILTKRHARMRSLLLDQLRRAGRRAGCAHVTDGSLERRHGYGVGRCRTCGWASRSRTAVGRHPHPGAARHPGRRPVPVVRTAARAGSGIRGVAGSAISNGQALKITKENE